MTLLSKIKKGVAESGSSKGKMLFFKDGSKIRVRFLQDLEDGIEITMHDSFDRGIQAICRGHFDEECPYCEDSEGIRNRQGYAYSVWDEEAKEVKIFLGFANNFNPLPQLVGMYEAYETLTDRDYVISQTGKQTTKQFSVVPMDKVRFRNKKAKPYSEDKLLELLGKAYPVNEEDATEISKKNGKKKTSKKQEEPDDDDDDDEVNEYEGLSAKELYIECKERGLKVQPKKKAQYYIDLLEEDDAKGDDDDWEDDEDGDDDEW
jgi:hypothetical protein